MIGIGLVGYGYWGPNLARNFSEIAGASVVGICDSRPTALSQAEKRFPSAKLTLTVDEMIVDPAIDAVVIATPVSTHASVALAALRAGKHVLVTKPLADSSAAAREIVQEAERRKLVLLVDHTFVYMGAVQKIAQLIAGDELGELYYFDSCRVNLGLYQNDVSVLWDLAIHDLSIIGTWIPERPRAVSCIAAKHVGGKPEDVAYMTLLYDDNFIAHVNVNWLSPVKIRRTLLAGTKKMIVFDDLDPVEKIRVYDRGLVQDPDLSDHGLGPIAYRRTGDVWMPQFDLTEALRVEAEHFVECITSSAVPRTGGRSAVEIIEVLEAAERSMRDGGRAVLLEGAR